jgi:DNA-binding Xre family transcriptional regulator
MCKVLRKHGKSFKGMMMIVSYRKLWHLLIDKKLKKADLRRMTGLSATTVAALSADKVVSLDVLFRICDALDCDLFDIIEASRTPQNVVIEKEEVSNG